MYLYILMKLIHNFKVKILFYDFLQIIDSILLPLINFIIPVLLILFNLPLFQSFFNYLVQLIKIFLIPMLKYDNLIIIILLHFAQ